MAHDASNWRVIVGLVMCMSALPIAYRMLALKFNPESGPVRQFPLEPDHEFIQFKRWSCDSEFIRGCRLRGVTA